MTSRCQGLFPPHPFFKGKALETRLVKTGPTGAKTFHASFKEHFRELPCDRKASKLVIGGQNTLADLTRDRLGIVKRKS